MTYDVKVGRRTMILDVPDLATASRLYARLRDESGEGYSTWPDGSVVDRATRRVVAHISYNGKVWANRAWAPGAVPLHDPYAGEGGAL